MCKFIEIRRNRSGDTMLINVNTIRAIKPGVIPLTSEVYFVGQTVGDIFYERYTDLRQAIPNVTVSKFNRD